MNIVNFIEKYEEVLKEKKISKAELYENCGFSSSAVSQWKAGATKPSMSTIENISKFLGIPMADLLIDETKKYPSANSGEEVKGSGMNPDYYNLNGKNKEVIDAMIATLLKSQSDD